MKKFLVILIILLIIIIGYRSYSYFQRKSVVDSKIPKKTTVLDDVKGIMGIEKKTEEPLQNSEKIRMFVPKNKKAPTKTYTNKDIENLNIKKLRLKKFITEKDLEKYKEKPDNSHSK